MATYNTSSAYDLSAFEAAPKKQGVPEIKVVKNHKKTLTSAFNPRVLSAFAIVVTLVCLMVYNQVQLTEITGEINGLSKEMSELESDNAKKTSALESTVSLDSVKKQAQALGMQPRDEYQTRYIYLYQQDKIERTEVSPEPSGSEKAQLAVTSVWTRFKEYLGG